MRKGEAIVFLVGEVHPRFLALVDEGSNSWPQQRSSQILPMRPRPPFVVEMVTEGRLRRWRPRW